MGSTLFHHVFNPTISAEIPFTIEIPLNGLPDSVTSMDADITSFLTLIFNRSNIRILFTGSWKNTIGLTAVDSKERLRNLNHIFSFEHREAWGDALQNSIARIELSENLTKGIFQSDMEMILRKKVQLPVLRDLGFHERCLQRSQSRDWVFVHVTTER